MLPKLFIGSSREALQAGLVARLQAALDAKLNSPTPTIEIVPPKLWVLAFERLGSGWTSATRLTMRVHALPAGSEVDVLQDGFQRLPLSVCLTVWETYRHRWRDALSRLAEVAVPVA